jgi:hypothetical protein
MKTLAAVPGIQRLLVRAKPLNSIVHKTAHGLNNHAVARTLIRAKHMSRLHVMQQDSCSPFRYLTLVL